MVFNEGGKMEKIIMVIEQSGNHYGAYSESCDGIFAAGDSIEEVKADTLFAIQLIKKNLPPEQWPVQLCGDYELVWVFKPQGLSKEKKQAELVD